MIKLSKNEKFEPEEIKKIIDVKSELENFVDNRTFESNEDLDYLHKITKS